MTLTIQLPPAVEQRLRDRAAQSGLALEAYARKLIEQGLDGGADASAVAAPTSQPGMTLDEILAPLRQEVEESGMADDELREFFTEVRDEVRAEKRAQGKPTG